MVDQTQLQNVLRPPVLGGYFQLDKQRKALKDNRDLIEIKILPKSEQIDLTILVQANLITTSAELTCTADASRLELRLQRLIPAQQFISRVNRERRVDRCHERLSG
jgi:hypothetical protein